MFKKVICWLTIAAITLTATPRNVVTVYFFNPESSVDNFRTLKIAFDSYLSKHGKIYFQPFLDSEVFEQAALTQKSGVAIMSHGEYVRFKKKYGLYAQLMGTIEEEVSQKHYLISVPQSDEYRRHVISSASQPSFARRILRGFSRSQIRNADLLTVPKELDAVLSVVFGMSDGAIATKRTLDIVREIHPEEFETLVVEESPVKTKLSVVVLFGDPKQYNVSDILAQMAESESGRRVLRLLGLDGWHELVSVEDRQ